MAYPSVKKGNKLAEIATQPRPGVALDQDEIARLLRYYHGNVSRVADKMGCSRYAMQRRINANPELQQVKLECRERFIDELEECSWHKALQGDTIMQLFLLKTIGKSRGYDQNDAMNAAQDVAKAAFEFILNRTKNPAQPSVGHAIPPSIELSTD